MKDIGVCPVHGRETFMLRGKLHGICSKCMNEWDRGTRLTDDIEGLVYGSTIGKYERSEGKDVAGRDNESLATSLKDGAA